MKRIEVLSSIIDVKADEGLYSKSKTKDRDCREENRDIIRDEEVQTSMAERTFGVSQLPFAYKLHVLLNDVETLGLTGIISWVCDGKAFKIHDPKEFEKAIQPRYFRQTKLGSFVRQVRRSNRCEVTKEGRQRITKTMESFKQLRLYIYQCYIYGFAKIEERGSNRGAFVHPDFCREDQESAMTIQRRDRMDQRKPVAARAFSNIDKMSCKLQGILKTPQRALTQTIEAITTRPSGTFSSLIRSESLPDDRDPLLLRSTFDFEKDIYFTAANADADVLDPNIPSSFLTNLTDALLPPSSNNECQHQQADMRPPQYTDAQLWLEPRPIENYWLEPRPIEKMLEEPVNASH